MENAPKVEGTSSGTTVLDGGLGAWLPIETAPHDNTLLLLLVEPDDHATEDAALCRTIGGNNRDNDGEDRWQFAGWCWTHDHFTEGTGKVLGWLPMPDAPNREIHRPPVGGPVECEVRFLCHK